MLFIFDMGGVVTTTFQMDELYRRLNMNSKEFMSVCKEEKNIWRELEKGRISVCDFWKEFNERTKGRNIPPVKNYFKATQVEQFLPFELFG